MKFGFFSWAFLLSSLVFVQNTRGEVVAGIMLIFVSGIFAYGKISEKIDRLKESVDQLRK